MEDVPCPRFTPLSSSAAASLLSIAPEEPAPAAGGRGGDRVRGLYPEDLFMEAGGARFPRPRVVCLQYSSVPYCFAALS